MEAIEVQLECPKAIVLLACDDLATDLGGQIAAESQVESLRNRAIDLLKEALQLCNEHFDCLPAEVPFGDARGWAVVGGSVVVAGLAVALTGQLPLALLGLFAYGLGQSVINNIDSSKRRQQLALALRRVRTGLPKSQLESSEEQR